MTIIFGPDQFTVAADTNIDAYPAAGANYAYLFGSGSNMIVNAANDRVQPNVSQSFMMARCINASVPTTLGDQEARADCLSFNDGGPQDATVGLALRYNVAATRGYLFEVHHGQANELRMYEENSGRTLIASADRGLAANTVYPCKFRAVGGATNTDLSLIVNGTAALTFTDTTAPATGQPGINIFQETGSEGSYADNFEVDDLVFQLSGVHGKKNKWYLRR